MIDKRVYFPKDQKNLADTVCFSQHLMPLSLLYPYIRLGKTYFIVTELLFLFTIYFAPFTAIYKWRYKFENLIDRRYPVIRKLRIFILYNDFKGDEIYYYSNSYV